MKRSLDGLVQEGKKKLATVSLYELDLSPKEDNFVKLLINNQWDNAAKIFFEIVGYNFIYTHVWETALKYLFQGRFKDFFKQQNIYNQLADKTHFDYISTSVFVPLVREKLVVLYTQYSPKWLYFSLIFATKYSYYSFFKRKEQITVEADHTISSFEISIQDSENIEDIPTILGVEVNTLKTYYVLMETDYADQKMQLVLIAYHFLRNGYKMGQTWSSDRRMDVNTCIQCQNSAAMVCGNCENTIYCSSECQTDHWPVHRKICKNKQDK